MVRRAPTDLEKLIAAADKAMAAEKVSARDLPQDRLFAILMARLDALQAKRTITLDVIQSIRTQPPLLAKLAPLLLNSMKSALKQAGLAKSEPRLTAQAAGLLAAYGLTLRAWEKDTTSDLSSTMRALDQNLQRAAKIATWLGFEAA